jgi:hypothetical protein
LSPIPSDPRIAALPVASHHLPKKRINLVQGSFVKETTSLLLGLVATNEFAEDHLLGLASAATARGWRCRCFLTDLGVRLLRSPELIRLAQAGAVNLAVCEHSWQLYGSGPAPNGALMASQYQNAELALLCDKVIVF